MPQVHYVLRELAILAFPILLAITVHEAAHGYTADRLGDPTPRRAGRLTLNPLAHLDLAGSLVFLLTRMIGWAKPMPVNPLYFQRPRRDMVWVSLAGPAANFALAAVLATMYRFLAAQSGAHGSGVGAGFVFPLVLMVRAGVIVNLGLGLFNLIPIPPLDGSRVLAGFLPGRAALAVDRFERWGFVALLFLVFSGALDWTIYPALRAAARTLLGT
jgi:Zn-dependent protease